VPQLKRGEVRSQRVAMVMAVALGAASLVGCGRSLDDTECVRLLDHYTELLVLEENPGATPERVAHEKDRARAVARKDARFEFKSCPRKISRDGFECAMGAPTVDAVERCLVF
jgi:hypothetical protein